MNTLINGTKRDSDISIFLNPTGWSSYLCTLSWTVTRLRGNKTLMLWLYLVKLVKQAYCLLAKKLTRVEEMENILSLSFTPVSFSASRQVQCLLYDVWLHLKRGITPLHAGYHGNIQERKRLTISLFLSH